MKAPDVCCPEWLKPRLEQQGNSVPFSTFMDWALHDPEHGAYGSGHLQLGVDGDFVTSPSLGEDFCSLLAVQLREWLELLAERHPGSLLSIVEVGPGEGDMVASLMALLQAQAPELLPRLEFVLVELNPGMESRQRLRFETSSNPRCRWCSLDDLSAEPVTGILIAHELLDALPVERLVLRDGELRRQMVTLNPALSHPAGLLSWDDDPLPASLASRIQMEADRAGVRFPPPCAEDGWATEWHHAVSPWMQEAFAALHDGMLLVVDYALEASRYYAPLRRDGTLMAYSCQTASADILRDPGRQDITAHLCLDTLVASGCAAGWRFLGQCRQGEALLALGLAERLTALQQIPGDRLGEALNRRESLLRLVDPSCLGDLRWLAFSHSDPAAVSDHPLSPRFLQEP